MGGQSDDAPAHDSDLRRRGIRRRAWIGLLLWPVLTGPASGASLEPAAASSGGLVAVRIDARNAQRTIQGGPDAIGGIGDWALQNGTLCALGASERDPVRGGGGSQPRERPLHRGWRAG